MDTLHTGALRNLHMKDSHKHICTHTQEIDIYIT